VKGGIFPFEDSVTEEVSSALFGQVYPTTRYLLSRLVRFMTGFLRITGWYVFCS